MEKGDEMNYDVVLLPSYEQVEAWRKDHADARSDATFGQVVSTFDAWVGDLWELWGDGRLVADGVQRELLLHAVASRVDSAGTLRGVVRLAADCLRAAAGVDAFENAVGAARAGKDVDGLSPREQLFLQVLACYEDELEERGLLERGAAAGALADQGNAIFAHPVRVLMAHAAPLTWAQERFFARCANVELTVQPAPGAQGVTAPTDGVDVQMAYPSGALAEPGLVGDAVEQLGRGLERGGRIVVAAVDPFDMCERLQRRLGGAYRLAVQANTPFARTDFGRTFSACLKATQGEPWDVAALSDVVAGPFSGVSRAVAVDCDKRWRANRILTREEALSEVREASDALGYLVDLAEGVNVAACVGALTRRVQGDMGHDGAWKAVQLAALRAVERVFGAGRAAGVGIDAVAQVLERMSVSVSARTGSIDPAATEVLFTTVPNAARMKSGSCAAVIVTDLTSEHYPIADKDDAASTFLSKLGLERTDSALERARRTSSALAALPTEALVLMQPLHGAGDEDTSPAVMLEEIVDACRNGGMSVIGAGEGQDESDLLLKRGEELLFANAEALGASCGQAVQAAAGDAGIAFVSEARKPLVMVRRYGADGELLQKACPSPSQIELYLECPLKWFAQRRMHAEALDEGFGPLERGSFAHAVLEEFYRRFRVLGHAKVTADNLAQARELMRAVAGEVASSQYAAEPGSGRYVAVNELERREVAALCDQLVAYLDLEARLLPTFHPAYLEYEIDASHAVDYAGYLLVGKVDRIDVDDAGHAVIVDYKGSLTKEHDIADKTWTHPGKVQTRMYARAIERALGLQVVGALYVSYGRRQGVSGAFDARMLEAAHLPAMRHERCSCGLREPAPDRDSDEYAFAELSFPLMLDETEALAAEAIANMQAGVVDARPAYEDACTFCDVLACPKRGA